MSEWLRNKAAKFRAQPAKNDSEPDPFATLVIPVGVGTLKADAAEWKPEEKKNLLKSVEPSEGFAT